MSQDGFKDSPEYKKGASGEQLVARELMARMWYILPSYDYSGRENNKAPRLEGLKGRYVLPDLLAFRDALARWWEVKVKASATYTRIKKRLEHGIPRRHYDDYLAVERITGIPVYLFVIEEDTGTMLYGKLSELAREKRVYSGDKMSYGGMVFFSRNAFTKYEPLQQDVA
jgi:hypothetical protein